MCGDNVPVGEIWASKLELEWRWAHSRLAQVVDAMRFAMGRFGTTIWQWDCDSPDCDGAMLQETAGAQTQARAYPKKRCGESKT